MATTFKERPVMGENLISVEALRKQLQQRVQETRADLSIPTSQSTTPYEELPLIENEKSFTVSLYDIDESLGYFFKEVIHPTVEQAGETLPIPVIYGSPERWKSLESDGMFRDEKSKLVLPLIMYRRTSLTRNENLYFPRLRDQLHFITKRKYDPKNRYNNFNLLNKKDKKDTDKYAFTAIPNFVVITYEGMIWTNYIEQINKVVEKLVFAEGTYWGDPNKFKFRTEISDVSNEVELVSDMERSVRANLTMTLYGYILPEEFDYRSTTEIAISPRKVIFKTEVVSDIKSIK
jgi:hypothetical protein